MILLHIAKLILHGERIFNKIVTWRQKQDRKIMRTFFIISSALKNHNIEKYRWKSSLSTLFKYLKSLMSCTRRATFLQVCLGKKVYEGVCAAKVTRYVTQKSQWIIFLYLWKVQMEFKLQMEHQTAKLSKK